MWMHGLAAIWIYSFSFRGVIRLWTHEVHFPFRFIFHIILFPFSHFIPLFWQFSLFYILFQLVSYFPLQYILIFLHIYFFLFIFILICFSKFSVSFFVPFNFQWVTLVFCISYYILPITYCTKCYINICFIHFNFPFYSIILVLFLLLHLFQFLFFFLHFFYVSTF